MAIFRIIFKHKILNIFHLAILTTSNFNIWLPLILINSIFQFLLSLFNLLNKTAQFLFFLFTFFNSFSFYVIQMCYDFHWSLMVIVLSQLDWFWPQPHHKTQLNTCQKSSLAIHQDKQLQPYIQSEVAWKDSLFHLKRAN